MAKNLGMDSDVISQYANEIKAVVDLEKWHWWLGGNDLLRDETAQTGIERAWRLYGMLATVITVWPTGRARKP